MKLLLSFLFFSSVFVAQAASAQVPGCFESNPHSFHCQQGAFFGHLFPLAPATSRHLEGRWRTLVYTEAPGEAPQFHSRFSSRNPRVPVGVENLDSSIVGALSWPDSNSIRFQQFRGGGNHLNQIGEVRISDRHTAQVPFFNPLEGTQELLVCRVFVRNRTDHMICQWLRRERHDFRFLGYFGFVR